MRLDKFLCEMNIGTRSQVKNILRQGLVSVNGTVVKTADFKIDEHTDIVCFKGEQLLYEEFVYYMLNKPEGVVSASCDNLSKTVLDLLGDDKSNDLFPVGRLDKDTTGLLLITNDGELAHRLLSPKKHVDKTYEVTILHPLSQSELIQLEQGVDIGEKALTLPAKVEVIDVNIIHLTIHEGKFHQVKRMLQAVGNQVTALKRISFGNLKLDETLSPGDYRRLTEHELKMLL